MDLARLGQGEKVAGISGVLLILFMFIFDWFGIKFEPPGVLVASERMGDAWSVYGSGDLLPTDIVLFVAALAAIGLGLLAMVRGPAGVPVAVSAIVAGLGLLSVVLVVVSIISPPTFGGGAAGEGEQVRKIGVWLGLIAAVGIAAGGYMATHRGEATAGTDPI
jgi:hypothetical protein